MQKNKLTASVIVISIIVVGCMIFFGMTHRDKLSKIIGQTDKKNEAEFLRPIYKVRTHTIDYETNDSSYTYSGEVRGRYETHAGFQVGGKIIKRNVELGSVVKKGDVLMTIDEKDLVQGVKSSDAQVFAAQSQLRLAEINLNRYRGLLKQGAICRADFDQAQTAFDAANAAIRQARAQQTQYSNLLEYSKLVAEHDGIISGVFVEVGQIVGPGQIVLTLVRDSEKEIEINIPENRLDVLQSANTIIVKFWALPDITIQGKVREISPVADFVSRTYKARISILNTTPEIKFGMTSSVVVVNEKSSKIIKIPISAVYQTGSAPSVWVVSNNTVDLRHIKINSFQSDDVAISEGLAPGDVIVTAGIHKLWKGQAVRAEGEKK